MDNTGKLVGKESIAVEQKQTDVKLVKPASPPPETHMQTSELPRKEHIEIKEETGIKVVKPAPSSVESEVEGKKKAKHDEDPRHDLLSNTKTKPHKSQLHQTAQRRVASILVMECSSRSFVCWIFPVYCD